MTLSGVFHLLRMYKYENSLEIWEYTRLVTKQPNQTKFKTPKRILYFDYTTQAYTMFWRFNKNILI